jgi:uncharacterized protein
MQRINYYHIWPKDLNLASAFHAIEQFGYNGSSPEGAALPTLFRLFSVSLARFSTKHHRQFKMNCQIEKRYPGLIVIGIAISLIIYWIIVPSDTQQFVSMIDGGDVAGVSRLLASHPELASKSLDRGTRLKPLDIAAATGNVAICSNLVTAGADINAQDSGGENPLYFSLLGPKNENLDVLKWLLQHGANITLTNVQGRTPLFWAIVAGSTNAVVVLLQHGADPTLKDYREKNALDQATEILRPNQDIIKILSEAISQRSALQSTNNILPKQ